MIWKFSSSSNGSIWGQWNQLLTPTSRTLIWMIKELFRTSPLCMNCSNPQVKQPYLLKVVDCTSTKVSGTSCRIKLITELFHLERRHNEQWRHIYSWKMIRNTHKIQNQLNRLTSSALVGSELTPRTGTESSIKWLACRRVPSPPTVMTRSTPRIGRDRSFRKIGSHSTGFFCKIFWQKLVASLWTLRLLSR